jgi:hypothetical protein
LKHDLAWLKAALADAPASSVKASGLARLVPQLDLGASPNWLFTSGKPGRYNPSGVNCVYFSETREVAQTEYDDYWKGLTGALQPVTMYFAEAKLQPVLDLTDAATLKALDLDTKELFKNWRRAKHPTLTQLLGQAASETGLFCAIRYPSKSAAGRRHGGVNLAIFRDCIRSPNSVCILGPGSKPIQKWP